MTATLPAVPPDETCPTCGRPADPDLETIDRALSLTPGAKGAVAERMRSVEASGASVHDCVHLEYRDGLLAETKPVWDTRFRRAKNGGGR